MQLIKTLLYISSITICVCISSRTNVTFNHCLIEFTKKFLLPQPLTIFQETEATDLVQLLINSIPITIRDLSNLQNAKSGIPSNRRFFTSIDIEADNIFEYDMDTTSNYILSIKETKSVHKIAQVLTSETFWDSHAKYVVVFKTNEKGDQVCTQVLQALQDNFIYNAVCAILEDAEIISFYTWYPYTIEGGCDRKVKAKYIGSCTSELKDPYKNKIPKNLNGCRVKLGWYGLSNADDVFDFRALQMFGKLRNSSIEFHRNDEYLHEVFQNRTLSLIFKDIRSKFIDIGPPLGLSNIVYAAFECVLHYGMDFDLYWILPQRRPISLFIKLMAEDYIGLILTSVLAMFAALTATWWAVVHFDTRGNFSHALISVISLCLACPLPFSPASRKMRMLLMFCFGAFIPLNVVVQSFVTSTLTEPYLEPKLENIYDLARSDLAMKYQYGLGINIIGGVDNTTRNMILRKSIPLVIYDIEEMRGINRTAILAFTQILWYLRNHEEAEKYKERVTLTIAQFCVPKGYPLTDQLKDVFLKSFEAGLHVRWNLEWKFLGTKVDYNKTRYVVSPMTLHDILVALYVLAFGLLSATIAFKAEIFVKKIWKN